MAQRKSFSLKLKLVGNKKIKTAKGRAIKNNQDPQSQQSGVC